MPDGRCAFCVWAPAATRVELELLSPQQRSLELEAADRGYFHVVAEGVGAGARYRYRLDGGAARPDPASRSQPDGVHGASEVVDLAFAWSDDGFRGLRLT
jgi:maltooligosyltrehalose trehalohydrolase